MFLLKYTGSKAIGCVIGKDGHTGLAQNGAFINACGYEVDSAAMLGSSLCNRPFVRVKARECGKKGRMYVKHFPFPSVHQKRR
ncbi:hypothetical protein AA106555_0627 [Neokomagataea thailandica NBRC 106555]|uniref:Uncharacterized protein n=1 Tax=Neokomagataea thailandica NBRC 106555 TaxID=1223520 RepID=A0ABQ0QNQ0_9PROT|nr:hypothetical protein AA106555_0627 [Neokomagataea thailandica NBRC 106555]